GLERRARPRRSGYRDYGVTKFMNVLHAKELARRLAGTRVTTYALHPGVVASNIWRALPLPLQWLGKLFMLSNEQGAESPLYCAAATELAATTGRYYDRMHEVRPSPLAEDARSEEHTSELQSPYPLSLPDALPISTRSTPGWSRPTSGAPCRYRCNGWASCSCSRTSKVRKARSTAPPPRSSRPRPAGTTTACTRSGRVRWRKT